LTERLGFSNYNFLPRLALFVFDAQAPRLVSVSITLPRAANRAAAVREHRPVVYFATLAELLCATMRNR
jgi:hypothetical protein